jgi:hypothetical protein
VSGFSLEMPAIRINPDWDGDWLATVDEHAREIDDPAARGAVYSLEFHDEVVVLYPEQQQAINSWAGGHNEFRDHEDHPMLQWVKVSSRRATSPG